MAVKGGIQRVQLEIEIPSEKDFDDISKTGFKFLNKWISDLVQKVLNELNPNGDYIINRLEIDLKIIDFQNSKHFIMLTSVTYFGKLIILGNFSRNLKKRECSAIGLVLPRTMQKTDKLFI